MDVTVTGWGHGTDAGEGRPPYSGFGLQAGSSVMRPACGKDAEWINRAFSNPDTSARLAVAFPVLCPDNVALLGIAVMPNGDPVFPGYPALVDVSTIDERVANWFEGKLIEGQVVALAPRVYTPYNPSVPDLVSYLTGPNDGDCAMRSQYFPGTGGACGTGVQ